LGNERSAVHSQSHESVGIEGFVEGYAADEFIGAGGKDVHSFECHVAGTRFGPGFFEKKVQWGARKNRIADSAASPAQTIDFRFKECATVSGTFQSIRNIDTAQDLEFAKTQIKGMLNFSPDLQAPLVQINRRH